MESIVSAAGAPVHASRARTIALADRRHAEAARHHRRPHRVLVVADQQRPGPAFPWGHVFAGDGMGMESQWHSRLAAAAIGARGPAPAPGRAVPDVRERALAYGRRLAAICEGFRGRVGDIDEVLRFIAYNEHAVALDALVSRFIDADAADDPRLELAELEALVGAELRPEPGRPLKPSSVTTSHAPEFTYYFVSFRCCADPKSSP